MMNVLKPASVLAVLVAAGVAAQVAVSGQAPARATTASVTFTKDIAPILQKSCQNCHRPGQMAPMSFLTSASAPGQSFRIHGQPTRRRSLPPIPTW